MHTKVQKFMIPKLEFYRKTVSYMFILINKLFIHFSYYLNKLPCREETLYLGDNSTTPYLYKGQHTLSFEQRIQVLLDVDSSKICHSKPSNVMENAAFVADRTKLKNCEDWLD